MENSHTSGGPSREEGGIGQSMTRWRHSKIPSEEESILEEANICSLEEDEHPEQDLVTKDLFFLLEEGKKEVGVNDPYLTELNKPTSQY